MLKLPYGLADFRALRTEGYLYLDRTAYIRDFEQLGRVLTFLRPRRFGKSLWLDTLRSYYDLRFADELDRLFGGLAIGREPTPLHGRYFVLKWDFSEIDAQGDIAQIGSRLAEHVALRARAFAADYEEHLPLPIETEGSPAAVIAGVLRAVRKTPHKLYLLIDEYDNFINEVMVRDTETYKGLVRADGALKSLFKIVKAATQGEGLERVVMTGVSPMALSDLSSGFNIARNVSQHPRLATLCGFTEDEIRREILTPMVEAGALEAGQVGEAMRTMHEWYNGYCFSPDVEARVLNPTNCLHLLQNLQELGQYPHELHDRNLAMDRAKLAFLSQARTGAEIVSELTEGSEEIQISGLETQISLEDLVSRIDADRRFLASFLYYLGLLTLVGDPAKQRLGIPNLMVRKIYLDRLLELRLPEPQDRGDAEQIVQRFFHDGELGPLLAFIETRLFPVLSHRDSAGMKEVALKTLLLALLFDDRRYLAFSELEAGHGHADLCLLRRPLPTTVDLADLLFELKQVPLKKVGLTSAQLRELDDAALRSLAAVREAFAEARAQIERYRAALTERFGAALRLCSFAVVAVGLERVVGEEV